MLSYRPEVDGLRAIAVLPVILFHAGFTLFSGGFVGVTVFFVISGYLITSIIVQDIEAGRFSLMNFYERRARRILPALFFVALVSIPIALLLKTPDDLEFFAKSLLSILVFASNILFWQESGYFGLRAELAPLLHTWSLAVEEQFYILFPLVLMLLWLRARLACLLMLVAGAAVSLALAIVMIDGAATAAFYLLPTRAWELMVGAFVALYTMRRGIRDGAIAQVGSLIGLGMVGYAVFAFDPSIPYPGYAAMVPTFGTALIILCAAPGTLVNRLLSLPVLVGVGLISYSAYLWHQPLMAYVNYFSATKPSPVIMALLVVATLLLALWSWRYIETPFRNRVQMPTRRVLVSLGVTAFVLGAVGLSGVLKSGWTNTVAYRDSYMLSLVSPQERERFALVQDATRIPLDERMIDDGVCQFWAPYITDEVRARFDACYDRFGPAVALLGDSHAMNLHNIFAKTEAVPFLVGFVIGGCRLHDIEPGCNVAAFEVFAQENQAKIKHLVYHQSGSHFIRDAHGSVDSRDAFETGDFTFALDNIDEANRRLNDFISDTAIPTTWIGPFLEYRGRLVGHAFFDPLEALHPAVPTAFADLEATMSQTVQNQPYTYVPFAALYAVPNEVFTDGCMHFRDPDHFSPCGESAAARDPRVTTFLQGL